jgi:hypothetical protein
MRNTNKM